MKQIKCRKKHKCRFTKKEIPKGDYCWEAKEGYYSLQGRRELMTKRHIKMIKGFAWHLLKLENQQKASLAH